MRRILVLVTFQLIILATISGIAEFAARTWAPDAGLIQLAHTPNDGNCLLRSRTMGMVYAPNCSGVSMHRPRIPFRTNELGLRSDPLRHDASMRILAMGDSCTFGWKGRAEDAYPQQLERLLAMRGHEHTQVINAGIPGTSSYVGKLHLERLVPIVEPEIVILQYGFNDSFLGGDSRQELEANRRWYWVRRLTDFLTYHSTFWRWCQDRLRPSATDPPRLPPRQTRDEYRRNLADMISYLRERRIKVLMIQFNAGDVYYQAALDLARELDVPMVHYKGPLIDVVHPTSDGNRWLAEQVFATLKTMNVLP